MFPKPILNKFIIGLISIAIILLLILIVNPQLFLLILNIIWLIVFATTVLFIVVGVLTFLGRKKEASKIVDLFVEGSITFIDLAKFIKDLWTTFKSILIETAALIIPKTSLIIAILIYLFIIVLYKYLGSFMDVTIPTILLTIVVTSIAAVVTLPRFASTNLSESSRISRAIAKLKANLIDYFEVVVFILFITIDATYLYFLPKNLNIPIEAAIGDYDLMIRSIASTDHLMLTINLIIIGIAIELVRNIIRLSITGKYYYNNPELIDSEYIPTGKANLLKLTVRKTMFESKEEFLSLAAFTVFITFVFLFFPRLKLIALIAASLTGLVFDLIFKERSTSKNKEDLLARVFKKISRNKS